MYKDIADPVHGIIRLNELETDLLSTKAMLRLHGVHQLGLAHLVYPGANYTRHAHSIGACHNSKRMVSAIKRNASRLPADAGIKEDDFKLCCTIALLHDVGHYPFSHATEHVIKDYLSSADNKKASILVKSSLQAHAPSETDLIIPQYADHEDMGAFIIENDPEITEVLKRHGIDPKRASRCFRGEEPEFKLFGVISSDLDCDRLDYLRRTALSSGAPYGSVDINYLIDQTTLDKDGNLCFKGKAARAADHLLVSRFYDYMQIPYNKTAVALEWSLTQAIRELFKNGNIDPSESEMQNMVMNGQWHSFDDQDIIGRLRNLRKNSNTSPIVLDHLNAIEYRKSAKLIASWDKLRFKGDAKADGEPDIDPNPNKTYMGHKVALLLVKEAVKEFCLTKGIDSNRLFVWDTTVKFMKDGQEVTTEDNTEEPEYFAKAVHFLDERTKTAKRLGMRRDVLVGVLNHQYFSGLRLYYMPSPSERDGWENIKKDAIGFLVMKGLLS